MRVPKKKFKNVRFQKKVLVTVCLIAMTASLLAVYFPRKHPSINSGVTAVRVLEDASGKKTLDSVKTGGTVFMPQESGTVFRGRSHSVFWVRFNIAKDAPDTVFRYLELSSPNIENIDVFFENMPPVHVGKMADVRTVPVKSLYWYIPVPARYDPSTPVYVRIETTTIIRMPIAVITASQMMARMQLRVAFFALMFGVLFAAFVVNIFSFVILKKKLFITYAFYLFFLILYHIRVHGFMYFVPMPFSLFNTVLWISLSGFGLFLTVFAQQFMDLEHRLPRMNVLFNVFSGLFIVQAFVGVSISTYYANVLAYVSGLIIPLVIAGTVVHQYHKGFRELKYYLVAWSALLTATLIWALSPYAQTQFSADYFFIAGTSLDSLIFTFSIFDLIRIDLKEKEDIREREKYYQALSRTDALTGLYNRRYLSEIVKQMESNNEIPIQSALIMIDLDDFKNINDTWGHLIGDIILTRTGTKIKKHIRKSDIACRYGGDEFLLLLPGAKIEAAQTIAEEIRKEITAEINYSETGEEIRTSVSIGITETRLDDTFDGMFLRADAALYQAKKSGKNQIALL
jgi:two-component system, sensor histidine kinase LadS